MASTRGLTCQSVNEMLSAYLDSELDAGTTLQVAQHIERCTACASRLEQLAQLDACLKQSLASTDVEDQACRQRAAGINQAVLARIRAEAGIQGSSTTAQRLFRWSHRSGGWLSGWLSQWLSRPFSWRRLTVALSLGMACGLALMLVTRERFQPEAPPDSFQTGHDARPVPTLLAQCLTMHRFCAPKITSGDPRIAFGESRARAMAREKGVAFPRLSDSSLKFASLHFCHLDQTLVAHYYFQRDTGLVSVYFGGTEAYQSLYENCPEFRSEGWLSRQTDELLSAAIATTQDLSRQPAVWFITGKLSYSELQRLVADLGGKASLSDNQTSLRWNDSLDCTGPQPQVASRATGAVLLHDPSICTFARTSPS
ncbi:zf-HC2 domain-containing protein [Chloracidobacterium sp. MS 40/45]|jgi:hypothetical protein|uniref:anti-sigma factor family protein n=1 Tax=Chloracidobacterium aggregatum TaxID=2851959 RepID=UPI001B8CF55C|nr:zf-HC2 domain-containing protein [Chloracidobacterium aggregatum]QUW01123.1 zf-HC2 domain-containing protein [Chloracidobacterium sp. MS 40/45]